MGGSDAGATSSKSSRGKDGSATYSREETHFTDVACMKIVAHTRNMRAVVFHPFGDVLFVAAPDSPVTLANGDSNAVVGCRYHGKKLICNLSSLIFFVEIKKLGCIVSVWIH